MVTIYIQNIPSEISKYKNGFHGNMDTKTDRQTYIHFYIDIYYNENNAIKFFINSDKNKIVT